MSEKPGRIRRSSFQAARGQYRRSPFRHAIAERGELLDGDGAHLLVVLDEQDALAAVWQGAGFRPARRDHASLDRTRQEETHRRALA